MAAEPTITVTIRDAVHARRAVKMEFSSRKLASQIAERARRELGLPEGYGNGEKAAYRLFLKGINSDRRHIPGDMTLEEARVKDGDVLLIDYVIPFGGGRP